MKGTFAVGSDIGGSHISCALVDMGNHTIMEHSFTQLEVYNKGSAEEIVSAWGKAVFDCMKKGEVKEIAGIGLAMPGPFDYVNGIGLFEGVDKFDNLNGVDVASLIRKILELDATVPVRFMNDATSFAVGAVWSNDSLKDQNVLAITLGTGFGSAFIMESLPVINDPRVSEMGCLYHLPFKDGIADDTFSTRGMIKSYSNRSGTIVSGVKEIADRVETDPGAKDTFIQFGNELAHFLVPWIQSAEINEIIMGGNMTKAYSIFKDEFESELNNAGQKVNVRISAETDRMAILGSGRLSDQKYYDKVVPLLKQM